MPNLFYTYEYLAPGRRPLQLMSFKFTKTGAEICEYIMTDPKNQAWIESSTFDLVVIDALFNDCGFLLSHKFGAKTVLFGTTSVFNFWIDEFGLPAESYIPDINIDMPAAERMNVVTKALTAIITLGYYVAKRWIMFPE